MSKLSIDKFGLRKDLEINMLEFLVAELAYADSFKYQGKSFVTCSVLR